SLRGRAALKLAPKFIGYLLERTHHADAVLDLRIVAVMPQRWHSETGAQINLVTEKSEGGAEPRAQVALDGREFFDRAAAELCCDRCESFVCVVARQSKRHDGDTFDAWMIGREIVDRAAQDFAVVDLRAEHNLRVYLDLCVEQT